MDASDIRGSHIYRYIIRQFRFMQFHESLLYTIHTFNCFGRQYLIIRTIRGIHIFLEPKHTRTGWRQSVSVPAGRCPVVANSPEDGASQTRAAGGYSGDNICLGSRPRRRRWGVERIHGNFVCFTSQNLDLLCPRPVEWAERLQLSRRKKASQGFLSRHRTPRSSVPRILF